MNVLNYFRSHSQHQRDMEAKLKSKEGIDVAWIIGTSFLVFTVIVVLGLTYVQIYDAILWKEVAGL